MKSCVNFEKMTYLYLKNDKPIISYDILYEFNRVKIFGIK